MTVTCTVSDGTTAAVTLTALTMQLNDMRQDAWTEKPVYIIYPQRTQTCECLARNINFSVTAITIAKQYTVLGAVCAYIYTNSFNSQKVMAYTYATITAVKQL
eukprot:6936-Heterococcus_DN1.PRE.7